MRPAANAGAKSGAKAAVEPAAKFEVRRSRRGRRFIRRKRAAIKARKPDRHGFFRVVNGKAKVSGGKGIGWHRKFSIFFSLQGCRNVNRRTEWFGQSLGQILS